MFWMYTAIYTVYTIYVSFEPADKKSLTHFWLSKEFPSKSVPDEIIIKKKTVKNPIIACVIVSSGSFCTSLTTSDLSLSSHYPLYEQLFLKACKSMVRLQSGKQMKIVCVDKSRIVRKKHKKL